MDFPSANNSADSLPKPGVLRISPRTALLLIYSLFILAASLNAAPTDGKYLKSCDASECHPAKSAMQTIRHPVYLEQWCDRCHLDHTAQTKNLLKAEGNDLCLPCHSVGDAVGHTPEHPPGGQDCLTCHSPHESRVRHLLRDESQLKSCIGCHSADLAAAAQKPYHHDYFNPVTQCGDCHFAHRKGDGKYLRENTGETCLTCHDMAILVEGRHLANISEQINTAAHIHDPLSQNQCHACHTPHGSVQPSLLKDSYPAGNYTKYERENYQLCWTCHDPALAEATETSEATAFRDGQKNLHNVHVMQLKRGRACHLCHTAHASERDHLLRETIAFGKWQGDFVFETTANGATCTTACHRPKTYTRTTP